MMKNRVIKTQLLMMMETRMLSSSTGTIIIKPKINE